jgi:hypothetical protein
MYTPSHKTRARAGIAASPSRCIDPTQSPMRIARRRSILVHFLDFFFLIKNIHISEEIKITIFFFQIKKFKKKNFKKKK